MALGYLPVDRDQVFLLPPSMRDWLDEGHLVWFVLEVVDRVDTSVLHARHPNDGVGRRAYNPDMLLALLIYAYCTGVRSSRRIERLCEVDVAYRVICGGRRPDHTTIARFRQDHDRIAADLFVDVLELCAAAGLATVGVVAVDGTKMAGNTSLGANRTRAQIEAEVQAMFTEAAATDEAEDDLFGERRGDELPPELADPRRRGARLDAALRELEAQAAARRAEQDAARAARQQAWQQRRENTPAGQRPSAGVPAELELEAAREAVAQEEARAQQRAQRRAELEAEAAAQGRKLKGPKPDHDNHRDLRKARRRLQRAQEQAAKRAENDAASEDEQRVNVTDPDSRIMKGPHGWIQGYNAQAAVNDHRVAMAAMVTQDANDVDQCQPMIKEVRSNLDGAGINDPVGMMLFDAGYWSEENATTAGPDRLIATTKSWKLRKQARQEKPRTGLPPEGASPLEAMEHRLLTEEGSSLYARRGVTIEPSFGNTKENRGFRRFARRGLNAVDAEWKLIHTTANILTLYRSKGRAALA